jgi:type IV secretion system protein VirD4
MAFKKLGTALYSISKFIIAGKVLNTKKGAKLLDNSETSNFLSSWNKGLLIDGKNKRLSIKESYQNVCFVARVGVGKTTKYIIPNVLDKAKQNCSLAIHDPKGEVRDLTSGYLKANGYNIVVYNVQNVTDSHCFNSCIEAKDEIELEQIAETIIWSGNSSDKDSYWNNGATRILSVLIKCLSFGDKKYLNLPNLYHLLQHFGAMGEGLEQWIAQNCWNPKHPNDSYILNDWKGCLTGNQEAIQSFVGICLTALKSMTNRDLKLFFSKSDYKLSRFRKEKTAIFFITPPEQQQYYSFVTSLFFRSIFNECMRKEHLKGNSLPVYCLYDEFGNSYIPDFVSIANTIRGYGVSLSLILQTISQLELRYGRGTAKSIQGAINTNICLSSCDIETANYFSDLSGRVRERQIRDFADTYSDYREYNLLNSNEIRTMDENLALVISKNRNPAHILIYPSYRVSKWKQAMKFPSVVMHRDSEEEVKLVNI